MIVVVILTLNQKDRVVQCLKSLLDTDQGVPFEILLWDNGSVDGTGDIVKASFPQVDYTCHPTNLGVASGRNAGARLAMIRYQATHILFLDNDVIVQPFFVSNLWNAFRLDDHVGQTQGKLLLMDDPERLNDGGGIDIKFWLGRTLPVAYLELDRGQHDKVKSCVACGGAMMVLVDVFRQLHGFDTIFDPFGPEDIDFSFRLTKVGYKALYIPQSVAYHAISHTYGGEYDAVYARKKTRFWLLLLNRHATWPQKLGFFLVGAPFGLMLWLFRQGKRGNLRAFQGLWLGVWDFLKSSNQSNKKF
jgi:GT2 family glycosyltransferase